MQPVSAFVLAGGASTRMGKDQDKAFLALGGRTLLERALALTREVADDVRIVVAHGSPHEKFAAHAPLVEDIFPGRGPLAGIHAALRSSSSELNLMLAVDLPLVTPELLRRLIGRAAESGAVVTVPRTAGPAGSGQEVRQYLHPLCAVYRRSFAEPAEQALKDGRNRIDALFAAVPALVIEQEELERLGFRPEMLQNLNTPQDFERAAALSWS